MESKKSFIKWISVIIATILLHTIVFALTLPNKESVAKRAPFQIEEIDLDILEDASAQPIKESLESEKELAEKPPEPEEIVKPTPDETSLEQERIEQERIEQERIEQERIEQERISELEKKRLLEEKKQKLQEEAKRQLAEKIAQKKKEEIAEKKAQALAKKQAAEKDKKRKIAKALAAKKAATAKQQAQAKKKAKNASAISRRKPFYPNSLRRKGIEGTVRISVKINTSGKVSSASIYKSSGHSSFDKNALSAVKKWKYKPAYNGLGQPISDSKTETIIFKIK